MANLGNVAGVVVSANPPLEADGVTVKKYVLWAQPVTGTDYFVVKIYNYQTQTWDGINPASVIDDSMTGSTATSNVKTFSKFKILQLIAGVNKTVPFGALSIWKQEGNVDTIAEAGDYVQGWFTANKYITAIFNGGDPLEITNYTLLTETDF